MKARGIPRVDGRVVVAFLSTKVGGSVERAGDGSRELDVVTDDGELIHFALSPATGSFIACDSSRARLFFDESGSP